MKRLMIIALLGVLVLAACEAESTPAPTDAPTQQTVDPTPTVEVNTDTDTMTDSQSAQADDVAEETVSEAEAETVAYNGAEWTRIQLTDAVTGEQFTFADFAGQTVFVHPMARWCSNCRSSQINIRDNVLSQVNRDEVIFVSVTIEAGDSIAEMANYAASNGFNWVFTVATPELLSALVREFGPGVTNPPSQPHFILSPDGTATDLRTGRTSATEIIASLDAAS